MKKSDLYYITYQVFPNPKANNLQTIRMIDELGQNYFNVELIFPDRKININEAVDIDEFYDTDLPIKFTKLKHNLPFDKINYFKKINFVISSFLWSLYAVRKTVKKANKRSVFMTRTIWVFIFLILSKKITIYECHKFSKIDQLFFRLFKKNKNSIVIFCSPNLKKAYNLESHLLNNCTVLESSFKESLFKSNISKKSRSVIFMGQLLRFEKSRNIEFIIESFKDSRLSDFHLNIVGGPDEISKKLGSEYYFSNVSFLGNLTNSQSIFEACKNEIGILINNNSIHSMEHTSPIKYFEYLRAGNKIVAVDFKSHKDLPMAENTYFFNHNDKESFINAILKASDNKFIYNNEIKEYSYKNRTKKLYNHLVRLEGFEPPTS